MYLGNISLSVLSILFVIFKELETVEKGISPPME